MFHLLLFSENAHIFIHVWHTQAYLLISDANKLHRKYNRKGKLFYLYSMYTFLKFSNLQPLGEWPTLN
jgi:hypothetical protein